MELLARYIVYCDPMSLIAFLLLIIGIIFLAILLVSHLSSRHIKNSPSHLTKHRVALLFSCTFIIIGLIGIVITVKHANQEITGIQYQHLTHEVEVLPHLKQKISDYIQNDKHINRIKYCNIMNKIDHDKAVKMKKIIKKW